MKDPRIIELLKDKPELMCNLVFERKYETVKAILDLPYWQDPKFKPLLTSNIWKSNAENVEKILELKQWDDEKFRPLLTSTIWKSNAENVERKMSLPCWDKYPNLLTPSIFAMTETNIIENIKLFEEYGIETYLSTNALRQNYKNQRILLAYMVKYNIPLTEEVEQKGKTIIKLNPIINATPKQRKEKYGIDMDFIIKQMKGTTR